MALSNAERQARFRQSLKSKTQGVTPEMVREAAHMIYKAADDPEFPSWDDWCALCCERGNVEMWHQFWSLSDDEGLLGDVAASGGDVDLVERVLAVARAVMRPPAK